MAARQLLAGADKMQPRPTGVAAPSSRVGDPEKDPVVRRSRKIQGSKKQRFYGQGPDRMSSRLSPCDAREEERVKPARRAGKNEELIMDARDGGVWGSLYPAFFCLLNPIDGCIHNSAGRRSLRAGSLAEPLRFWARSGQGSLPQSSSGAGAKTARRAYRSRRSCPKTLYFHSAIRPAQPIVIAPAGQSRSCAGFRWELGQKRPGKNRDAKRLRG